MKNKRRLWFPQPSRKAVSHLWYTVFYLIIALVVVIGFGVVACHDGNNDTLYTVAFNVNGGIGTAPNAITQSGVGASIMLPPGTDLTRIGFVFGGWNTESDGTGTDYNVGASITPTSNTMLYARWLSLYTVTFDANGGSGIAPDAITQSGLGTSIMLSEGTGLTRTDYEFGGWNTESDGTGINYNTGDFFTPITDTTLYARWLPFYTVSFDTNGGNGTAPDAITQSGLGDSITLPEGTGLTRTDYEFGGWNTESDGTGINYHAGASITPMADTILYVRWLPLYTVTFDANGGSGTAPDAITQSSLGASITLPEGTGLTRTGFVFGGWNTESDGTGINNKAGASYTPTGGTTVDITLYAKWVALPEMVRINAGTFTMGSPADEPNRNSNETQHSVTLSDFYMGKYQVTQEQYEAVVGTLPSSVSIKYSKGDDYPVYGVNWYDVLVFCNKLSMQEGLTPAYSISGNTDPAAWGTVPTNSNSTWNAVTILNDSTGYRLPTEAQWEYACRAGTTTVYNTGSTITSGEANYTSTIGRTTPVGDYEPNAWGLYDMHGNVGEWCWDRYGDYADETQTDPTGAVSGTRRIGRGGYWGSLGQYIRSAFRDSGNPGLPDFSYGFRLARP